MALQAETLLHVPPLYPLPAAIAPLAFSYVRYLEAVAELKNPVRFRVSRSCAAVDSAEHVVVSGENDTYPRTKMSK